MFQGIFGQGTHRGLLDGFGVVLQADLERAFAFAAVERQDAMGRDLPGAFLELKVILVFLALAFGQLVALGGADLAGFPQHAADGGADVGGFGHQLRQQVLHPGLNVGRGGQSFFRIDEGGQDFGEIGDGSVAMPDGQGQVFQASFASGRRRRFLAPRLERQVQIVQPLVRVGVEHGAAQLLGQLPLSGETFQDGLLAVGDLAEYVHAHLDVAQHLLAQAARALFTVPGHERDRVAFVEQPDHVFHLYLADLEVLGDARTIERGYIVHCQPTPARPGEKSLVGSAIVGLPAHRLEPGQRDRSAQSRS